MKLTFLGAAREVGRSAVLLESGKRIMLDYGVKLGERTMYPMPFQGSVDAYVLSHAHLDHSGYSPALYEHANVPCFATPPTMALATLLVKDSIKITRLRGERAPFGGFEAKKFEHALIPLGYEKPFQLTDKTSITLFDAGHIPGAAMVQVYSQRKRVVYTGDFKMEQTKLHKGAAPLEKVDVLITESTYSERDHPARVKIERKLAEDIRATVEGGGVALLPSFAVGRSQELLMIMADLLPGIRTYIDGMSKTATEIVAEYPSYLRDANGLRRGMKNAEWVETQAQRKKAVARPGVIISSAGMLEGGPALSYLLQLNDKSKIILTGYQIEGTNSRTLREKKVIKVDEIKHDVKLPVEYYDMSAHAGKSELLRFIRHANPEKIFCMHGDHCEEFAEELKGMGFEAHAPKMGNSFEV